MNNDMMSAALNLKYGIMSIVCLLMISNTYGDTVQYGVKNPTTPHTASSLNKPSIDYFKAVNTAHLLDPDHYNEREQKNARATIAAFTNAINPLATINFTQLNNVNQSSQLKREEIEMLLDKNRPYIGLVQLYNAVQNIGLMNLRTIYNQRIATQPHTQSPLAQDKIRALHRIQNPEWKAQLKQADSAELQRQTLELMADQLAETHQTRMTLERLLATASVSLLQTNTLLRTTIEEQAKQVVGN